MDTLSLRFVFDRKNETVKNPTKKGLLQIEVYDKLTRKKVYISTGIKIMGKHVTMFELKKNSIFYSTPLSRNNSSTAKERKEAKDKFLKYAKKYMK